MMIVRKATASWKLDQTQTLNSTANCHARSL